MKTYTLTGEEYIKLWNEFVYSNYSGTFEFYIEEKYNAVWIDYHKFEFKSEKDLTLFLLKKLD